MRQKLIFIVIMSMLLLNPITSQVSADDRDVPYAYLYYSDFTGIEQDGIIGANEYPSSTVLMDLAGDFVTEVWWAHNDTDVAVGMLIEGTGWIGLGLGEIGTTMTGGNLIMASYDPETDSVAIGDMFANALIDPEYDEIPIIFDSVGGSEVDGQTVIEFTIPMEVDDPAGHDQFWHTDGRFGFFTAYQKSNKDFGREHSKHSGSETVEILNKSFTPPIDADFEFSIIDNKDGTITLNSEFSGGVLSDDLEIGFFQKTLFGNVFVGDVFTNTEGIASLDLPIQKTGELNFISLFYGDINFTRQQLVATLTIEEVVVLEDVEYNDLRDTLGTDFMRSVLIFLLFFFVAWLTYLYSATMLDVLKIYKIGSKVNSEKKEVLK